MVDLHQKTMETFEKSIPSHCETPMLILFSQQIGHLALGVYLLLLKILLNPGYTACHLLHCLKQTLHHLDLHRDLLQSHSLNLLPHHKSQALLLQCSSEQENIN